MLGLRLYLLLYSKVLYGAGGLAGDKKTINSWVAVSGDPRHEVYRVFCLLRGGVLRVSVRWCMGIIHLSIWRRYEDDKTISLFLATRPRRSIKSLCMPFEAATRLFLLFSYAEQSYCGSIRSEESQYWYEALPPVSKQTLQIVYFCQERIRLTVSSF